MSDFLFDPLNIRPGKKNEAAPSYMTVSQLNALAKQNLELSIGEVSVKGEVSNLRTPASGHMYFTLKDAHAQVSAVMFRSKSLKSPEKLEEGKEIIAVGTVSLYEARGTYQIIVKKIQTQGKGDLKEKFEKLVAKLRTEGLFDKKYKKEIPVLPGIIGVITSATGAAVKDIVNTVWERFPGAHIVLGPAAVQGDAAPGEIARMIGLFNEWGKADVLIVGRGGGSLEDLWAFNEEAVARAIFSSEIPVISAVGHEIDVTISDLVADIRALTPTEAGKLVVPDVRQENQSLDILLQRAQNSIRNYFDARRSELDYFRSHRVFAVPEESVRTKKMQAAELMRRLQGSVESEFAVKKESLRGITDVLESLNPLSVLKRGFSYTEDEKGKRVDSVKKVKKGELITTRLWKGSVISEVVRKDAGAGNRNTR